MSAPHAAAAPAPTIAAIQAAIAERRFEAAIALAEGRLALLPAAPESWNALGVALRAGGQPQAALGCYRRALDLAPADIAARANMANALKDLQRHPEAIALHRQVLARQPNAMAWSNLGVALHEGGMLIDALAAFEEAIRLDPAHASAHFDRAQVLLRLGRYAEGWAAFEWRWRLPEKPHRPAYRAPVWDGGALDGTLLVWPEQGFGDAILSVRFLKTLRQRVGAVALGCKPELARLFARLEGVDRLVPIGMPAPDHAAHVPAMSLPGLAMRGLADLPPPPRLAVAEDSRARLAPMIAPGARSIELEPGGARFSTVELDVPVARLRGAD